MFEIYSSKALRLILRIHAEWYASCQVCLYRWFQSVIHKHKIPNLIKMITNDHLDTVNLCNWNEINLIFFYYHWNHSFWLEKINFFQFAVDNFISILTFTTKFLITCILRKFPCNCVIVFVVNTKLSMITLSYTLRDFLNKLLSYMSQLQSEIINNAWKSDLVILNQALSWRFPWTGSFCLPNLLFKTPPNNIKNYMLNDTHLVRFAHSYGLIMLSTKKNGHLHTVNLCNWKTMLRSNQVKYNDIIVRISEK